MPSRTTSIAAVEFLPKNTLRKSFIVQNEDGTDSVFIKQERSENTTVSSTDHDYKLGPGSAMALNFLTDGAQAIMGRWTVIASANTPRIAYFETEDVIR